MTQYEIRVVQIIRIAARLHQYLLGSISGMFEHLPVLIREPLADLAVWMTSTLTFIGHLFEYTQHFLIFTDPGQVSKQLILKELHMP